MMTAMEKKVTVFRRVALEKLEKNREKHFEEYEQAVKDYRIALKKEVERLLWKLNNEPGVVKPVLTTRAPVSHLEDYDLAIRMLEYSAEEKIELDSHMFNAYFFDEWNWRKNFEDTIASYTAG
jgi:hypothetical protein